MNAETWRRLQALFDRAVELPPEARVAFLDASCSGDPELRRVLDSLLEHDAHAESRLAHAIEAEANRLEGPFEGPSPLDAGERVGPYRIERQLGRGGMGEVYLAVRADDQYRKQVAIKAVRAGLDMTELLRRFRNERQILATLEHPHIARLLDAGVTEHDRPYVVMEYVEGERIDQYCDRHRLTTEQRLYLFRSVCSAVQYAHRNLVVHRDLKPGNILVSSEGVPKLLDFGIAKLLHTDAPEPSLAETATAMRMLTPEYASPEQVQGEPITTSSDIYSLGVLLYELLSGRKPYRVRSRQPGELERAIVSEEPERPSAAATRALEGDGGVAGRTPQDISKDRGTQPERLRRQLAGDLDNIVLMALRKEPSRRYTSVEQLSEDLRRHLAGLPVVARKDTWRYRSSKFVGRHRVGVAAGVGLAVAVVGVAVTMSVQSARLARERDAANRERETAQQVSRFLVDLFTASDVADPLRTKGRDVTAIEMLEAGARRIEGELAEQPRVRAELMDTIARVYISLARYDEAAPLVEESLRLRQSLFAGDHPELAESLQRLSELREREGDLDAAEELCRRALDMRLRLFGEEHADVAYSLSNLGSILNDKGDVAAPAGLYRRALAIRRKVLGPDHPYTATSINNLAYALYVEGDFASAEPLYRESLELRKKAVGDDSFEVAVSLNNLANVLEERGGYAEAERLYRRSLEIRRKVLAPDHPSVSNVLNNLGRLLSKTGDFAESERLLRAAIENRRARLGPEHPDVAGSLQNYGRLLYERDELSRAESLLRESLATQRAQRGEDHPRLVGAYTDLARLLRAREDDSGARPLLERAVAIGREKMGKGHPNLGRALMELAAIESASGDPRVAESVAREAIAIFQRAMFKEHWEIAQAQSVLGEALAAQGRFQEAEPLLVQSLEDLAVSPGERARVTQRARARIDALYASWGKAEPPARFK